MDGWYGISILKVGDGYRCGRGERDENAIEITTPIRHKRCHGIDMSPNPARSNATSIHHYATEHVLLW